MTWKTAWIALLGACLCAAVAAQERQIEAPGPLGPLAGMLRTAPSPDAPLVLIVPGSGPTDRDGNGPAGLQASTYRLLAEGLAQRGIASLRIDKRGMFGSAAAVADANAVTIRDYAADVRQWVRVLRQSTQARCVWVLGHSEGGLVALAAAQDGAEGLCGLLLVATAGRPLGQVLREQLRANPANAPLLDQALAAIDTLEAGGRVDMGGLHPALRPLFRPAVQGFLIDSFARDPARLIAPLRLPLLIVQGERDIQIGVPDARRLHQAAPQATLALLPDTNHVLKTVATADRAANVATYGDPALPLAPGVVPAIADFIAAHPAPAGGR